MSGMDIKRLVRGVGPVLAVLGLLFVGGKLIQQAPQVLARAVAFGTAITLTLAILLHSFGGAVLGVAWREILGHLHVDVDRRWAVAAYAKSYLARYVPGNVFQYVGRQAIGTAAGIGFKVLIKSSFWELGILLSTSAVFGVVYWLVAMGDIHYAGAIGVFFAVTITEIAILRHVGRPHLSRAVGFYAIYLSIGGIVFAGFVLEQRFGQIGWNGREVTTYVSAYVIAWLSGVLTPGAPAGLGVREAALYGLLHRSINDDALLSAMLLSRAANVGGDLLFCLWATGRRYCSGRPENLS